MPSHRTTLAAAALAVALPALPAQAALTLPRPSPKASTMQTVGLTDFTVSYSRPGVKGRKIWGSLVPYDQPWRTGANEATSFVCSGDVKVEGQMLPAGTYSFFTIPSQGEWTVVFNKEKDLWGSYEYKPEQDALRVKVKPQATTASQEWLGFTFENLTPTSGELVMRWENLALPLRLEVDTHAKALASARTEVAAAKPDDWRTPYRAADYCFNSSVSPEEGKTWLQKSLSIKETYYNVTLQAKMAAKSGDTKQAVTLAQKAIQLGKADKDVDTAPTELLLAEWQGKK